MLQQEEGEIAAREHLEPSPPSARPPPAEGQRNAQKDLDGEEPDEKGFGQRAAIDLAEPPQHREMRRNPCHSGGMGGEMQGEEKAEKGGVPTVEAAQERHDGHHVDPGRQQQALLWFFQAGKPAAAFRAVMPGGGAGGRQEETGTSRIEPDRLLTGK